MDRNFFNEQIDRLRNQWANSYAEERQAIFWTVFQSVPNDHFSAAVTECLGTQRQAPLVNELSKAVEAAKLRAQEIDIRGTGSFLSVLEAAAKLNKKGDAEFVKTCLKAIRDKLDRKTTEDQFVDACNSLDSMADVIAPATRRRKRMDGREKGAGES